MNVVSYFDKISRTLVVVFRKCFQRIVRVGSWLNLCIEKPAMRKEVLFKNVGGGSNNKKDHAAGKNLRCPLSFLFFFVLFQNTFRIDVFCRIWSKMCPQKRTKKIMIFVFFDLLCSFLFFFVVFAGFG